MSRFEQFINRRYRIIVAILLLVNLSVAVTSILNKSLTYDEPIYIAVGNYMLKTGDIAALMPGIPPPLPSFVQSMFWSFLEFDPVFWRNFRRFYATNYQSLPLIFESGHNPDVLVFLARLPVILTFPLLGLMVFLWSRKLFGVKAGLFALVLAAFSPNLIAHERLATADFLAAVSICGALYFFRDYVRNPLYRKLVLLATVSGLALLTKFTTILLIPSYLVILFAVILGNKTKRQALFRPSRLFQKTGFHEDFSAQAKLIISFCVFSVFVFLVVWAGYLFEFRSLYVPSLVQTPHEEYFTGVLKFLYEKGLRIPAASYFLNLFTQIRHGQTGHPNFFMGETSWLGRWAYFPATFLIKVPIPTLIFLCIGLISILKPANRKKGEEAFLLVPMALYMLASISSKINIGLRHILPILPLLFIWVSRIVNLKPSKWYPALIALLVVWYVGENVYIYPHYLEYFNELVGGPKNGYKYLVDSNLDWGQDLKLLVRYLKKNNIRPERIAYFGTPHLLEYYGYEDTTRNCGELDEGYLVISATFLHNLYLSPGCYDWLKKYEPVDRIGYSIFIFRIPP